MLCFLVNYRSCPYGRCVGHAARPVMRVKGGLTVEVEAKILLRFCNPLDGRSGLGRSDQVAGHGNQVGVQNVWSVFLGLSHTDCRPHGSYKATEPDSVCPPS